MSLKTGKIGENYAIHYLLSKGYHLTTQNYFTRYGEIDIIVYKDGITSFVEVKTRKARTFGAPEESLTRNKALHLKRTSMYYLTKNRYVRKWQIDFLAVLLNSFDEVDDLRHYMNVQI